MTDLGLLPEQGSMSTDSDYSDYLLSFELEDEGRSIYLHGDVNGLKALAELLFRLAENTPGGYFDHRHLFPRNGLSEQGKGDQRINHVKIYCWRGDKPWGAPDYSKPQQLKSFADHGYSLAAIKQWRQQQADAGRPCEVRDFMLAHDLCVPCGATGSRLVNDAGEYQVCRSCHGSGRNQNPSE